MAKLLPLCAFVFLGILYREILSAPQHHRSIRSDFAFPASLLLTLHSSFFLANEQLLDTNHIKSQKTATRDRQEVATCSEASKRGPLFFSLQWTSLTRQGTAMRACAPSP